MKQILIIGLGGFLGAVLRYLMSRFFQNKVDRYLRETMLFFQEDDFFKTIGADRIAQRLSDYDLPQGAWGTTAVNLSGCFLVGCLLEYLSKNDVVSSWDLFVRVGFIASLTTFSTFVNELIKIYQKQDWSVLIFYFLLQIIGGCILFLLGRKIIELWQ